MTSSLVVVPIRRARSFGPLEGSSKNKGLIRPSSPPPPFPSTSLPNIQVVCMDYSSLLSLEDFPAACSSLLPDGMGGKKGRPHPNSKGPCHAHSHKPPKVLRKTWDKVKGIIHSGSHKEGGKRPPAGDAGHHRSSSPKTPESGRASPSTVQLHYLQLQRRLSQELHPRAELEEESDWEVMWKASTGRVQYTEEELIKHLPEDFSRKWREWDGGIARRQSRQRAGQRSRYQGQCQGSEGQEKLFQRVKEVREERKRVKEELRILEEEERSLLVEARLQGWKVELEEEPETEEEVSADITRSPSSISTSSTASEPQVSVARKKQEELKDASTQTDTVIKVTAQEVLDPEEEKLTAATSNPVIVPTKRLIFSPVWDPGEGLSPEAVVQGSFRSDSEAEVSCCGDSGSSSPALRVRRDRDAFGIPQVPKMGIINVPPWCSPLLGGRRGRGSAGCSSGEGSRALRPSRSFRARGSASAEESTPTPCSSSGSRPNPPIPTLPALPPISSPNSPSTPRQGAEQGQGKRGLYAQLKSKVVGSLAKSHSVGAMLKGNHH